MSTCKKFFSLAVGVGSKNQKGDWLEVFYPKIINHPDLELIDAIRDLLPYKGGNTFIEIDRAICHALEEVFENNKQYEMAQLMLKLEDAEQPKLIIFLEWDSKPMSTAEVYLKLHLLSYRMVKPNSINLEGVFSLLPNVAWTNEGAIDLLELNDRRMSSRMNNDFLSVSSVDKFPKMVDYVVPEGIRIADTARVRLGAYIGAGTTIMHEGFVNFNAGTAGKNMIEGRVSSGVWVDEGSDLGGGCSTMGTLSGGNDVVISIGEDCLIGAEAGVGIPLGDRCTIEAGLYLTAGSKITILDKNYTSIKNVKALELANKSDLLFRRNSLGGGIECIPQSGYSVLNDELHLYN